MLRTLLIAAATALLALLAPASSHAGSYWWNGNPTAGQNGFSWSHDNNYWNPWAGANARCETRAATIPAGSLCSLIWTVPANLDAGPGWIEGTYRHANANFEQRLNVECNGERILHGTATLATYHREWADMCGWLGVTIRAEKTTAVSAASQYFNAHGFAIHLTDPHVPSLNILDGHQGWKGRGGACVRYGFADAGSGIAATALVRVADGAHHDSPSFDTPNVVTGTFQTDRTVCVPAPGSSGAWGYEARAADKSGNGVAPGFSIAFDVTGPEVGVPHVNGAALAEGRQLLGSAGEYRPTFTFASGDPHSGVASNQILLDGHVVANGTSWTPASKLARGSHSVSVRATDAVGNVTTVTRSFVVVDDVAPTLTVTQPEASGDGEPLLDVSASDDHAGVKPSTWSVSVNGVAFAASSSTERLQVELGRLVDATHEIVVRVEDAAGNARTRVLTYVADGDGAVPQLDAEACPQLTCVHGIALPSPQTRIDEGDRVELVAVFARRGRPVAGTVRVRHGDDVLASAEIGERGVARLALTVDREGPLVLDTPAGSGLEPMSIDYTFVPDTTAPTLTVASPSASGDNEPVLDVTAEDTQTGIDASSWTVRVNGVSVVSKGDGARLQVELGTLADGVHEVVVGVRDGAGNLATRTLSYEADGQEGVPPLPTGFLSGIFVYERPGLVSEGETHRVKAVVVRDGRPATGRAELRRGATMLADAEVAAGSGVVDIAVQLDEPGPITLHGPEGAGLDPVTIEYAFLPRPDTDVDCVAGSAGCPDGSGSGTGTGTDTGTGTGTGTDTSTSTGTGTGGGGAPVATAAPAPAHTSGGYPRDTVYYVTVNGRQVPFYNGLPLAESGAKLDRVAPRWQLRLIQHRKGTVRRLRRVAFKLWTTEMSVIHFQPVGSRRRTTISPRRQLRTVFVTIQRGSRLDRTIRRARPGSFIRLRMRVVAIDRNENRSKPKWRTFRVRV